MKRIYTDCRFPDTELVYEGGEYFKVYKNGVPVSRFAIRCTKEEDEEYFKKCAENYFDINAETALSLLEYEAQPKTPTPEELVIETLY